MSGAAAGAAAILMVDHNWTTADMLSNVADLQRLLGRLGQPLQWTL